LKGIRTCLAVGVPVRVAILPDELDPAELLAENEHGASPEAKSAFERVLASARPDIDHLVRALAPRPYELERRELVAVVDQVLDALRPMPDAELKALNLHDIAEYFNLDRERLAKRLSEGPTRPPPQRGDDAASDSDDQASRESLPPILDQHQDMLLHLLVREPALRATAGDDLGLEPSHLPAPWDALLATLLLNPEANAAAVRASVAEQPHVLAAVGRWAATATDARYRMTAHESGDIVPMAELASSLADCVRAIRLAHCRRELARVKLQIGALPFSESKALRDEQKVLIALLHAFGASK